MKPAIINPENRTLSRKPAAINTAYTWASITSATLRSMPTLFDEIGLVCAVDDQELYVKETQEGFTALIDFLQTRCEFPENWYQRVERGEPLALEL